MGEGKRQSQRTRHLGTEAARAEQPDGRQVAAVAGDGADPAVVLAGLEALEEAVQLVQQLGQIVASTEPAQGGGGALVGAGGAADAEVDPAGEQGLQRPEPLGHHQRCVVGQHHPARPQPDARGARPRVCDQHLWRRAGDAGHVVVLGVPQPVIAKPLGLLHQRSRVGQRLHRRAVATHRGDVEHRQRHPEYRRGRGGCDVMHGAHPYRWSRTSCRSRSTGTPLTARRNAKASSPLIRPLFSPSSTAWLRPARAASSISALVR